jgi:pimeloyl-ACP methyl ester carboxylesterase
MARQPDPVLLLHGQPGSARDWDAVVGLLPAGVRALAIDRPGWNGAAPAGDLAMNTQVALAALDDAGIARATIAGHSFGAAVAAWLAAHHPDRAGALVLAAPAANLASLSWLDRWLAAPVAGSLLSVGLMASTGLTLSAPPARRLIGAQLRLEQRFLREAARTLRRPASWGAFAAEQRGLVRQLPELERALERIAAPTTIVIGSEDRIVRPRAARMLAEQIPGAALVVLDGADHLLPIQQPQRLAELIAAAR